MNIKKPVILTIVGLVILAGTLVGSVSAISLPSVLVNLNVVDGEDSYFVSTLSNVPAGFDVTNGVYPGWCSEFGPHMPRSTNVAVTLYDSYGTLPARAQDDDWEKVNWILNNKDGYSMWDIQYAIWYLISEETFHTPLSVNAQYLVDHAVDPYAYEPGNIIAIVAVPQEGGQCSIIELVIPPTGDEGLTPGFWKNHLSAWNTYDDQDLVGDVFTIPNALNDLSDDTLLEALQYKGGNNNYGAARILLRSAVAALLNAEHQNIDYPLASSAIIQDVNDALDDGRMAMLDLKDIFDGYNNLGADL